MSWGLSRRELGVLTGQVDAMAAEWEASKVPLGRRVVNFVIGDADSGPDPFIEPDEAGLFDKVGAWFGRNLIGGGPAAKSPAPFVGVFLDDPATAAWTHQGFSAVSEETMTRELVKAVEKAHDAGAEINIVAQGPSAPPVLKLWVEPAIRCAHSSAGFSRRSPLSRKSSMAHPAGRTRRFSPGPWASSGWVRIASRKL